MFRELERIAEVYGVPHYLIPSFINEVEAALKGRQDVIEEWHGRAESQP
jgi:hypothetical protein